MIQCSLGEVEKFKTQRALSGYSFAEISLPLDSYVDAATFTLTTDKEREYSLVSSEILPVSGTQVIMRAVGILKDQESFLKVKPASYNEATIESILNGIGIKGGSKQKVSLVNLVMTQGQLAILLANATAKTALVDFESKRILYYEDLYKVKALEAATKFQRIVSRVPQAGVYLYGGSNEGVMPEEEAAIVPMGEELNLPGAIVKHFVENYNNLALLFGALQSFTWDRDLELGSTILSPLTHSKCVICAAETLWTVEGHTHIYYAI